MAATKSSHRCRRMKMKRDHNLEPFKCADCGKRLHVNGGWRVVERMNPDRIVVTGQPTTLTRAYFLCRKCYALSGGE
mgnify:CR=1 FL=1